MVSIEYILEMRDATPLARIQMSVSPLNLPRPEVQSRLRAYLVKGLYSIESKRTVNLELNSIEGGKVAVHAR